MRFFLAFVLLIFAASSAFAQEETLLGQGTTFGGFGAPVWKISSVNGEMNHFGGVRGGWIINHTWILGYGTYSLGGETDAPTAARTQPLDGVVRPGLDLDFNYQGFEFEYVNNWEKLFHWGIYALIGGGNLLYLDPDDDDFDLDDTVFVLEPAFNGTLNVTRWFRAVVSASYRFVGDVDLPELGARDAGGPAVSVELRFGKF